MRNRRPCLPLGFRRAIRVATALVAMAQLLLVAVAPLADRPDSNVAAVHVEPAGTSTHHAHNELCATCVAMHLLWTPPREPVDAISVPSHARPPIDRAIARASRGLAVLLPRAPPA